MIRIVNIKLGKNVIDGTFKRGSEVPEAEEGGESRKLGGEGEERGSHQGRGVYPGKKGK